MNPELHWIDDRNLSVTIIPSKCAFLAYVVRRKFSIAMLKSLKVA